MCVHILLSLVLFAANSSVAPEDAELLHADGLLLEVDGKADSALAKLREAAAAQSQNVDYAADAARLAWSTKASGREADIALFLALTPKTAEQWLLRSYLEADRGESANAKAAVRQSLQLRPNAQEAIGVQNMLDQTPADAAERGSRAFSIYGLAGVEIDSNVTLIPDSRPFGQGGARLNVNAGGAWLPRTDNTQFSLGADLRMGLHLSNRTSLSAFDYFRATVAGTSDTRWGAEKQQRFAARLFMDQTTLGMFTQHFMQEFGAQVEYGYTLGVVTPGVYAEGSYRDFVAALYNPPGSTDRDGPRWAGGASLGLAVRDFAAGLRAGVQTEHAFGFNQRELGPSISLGARYAVWRLLLSAGVGYDGRFYYKSDINGAKRTDNRIPVSAAVLLNVRPWLGFELSYLYVRNLSSISPFDYSRHIGSFAVKGSY